jgi:hypothetical protein
MTAKIPSTGPFEVFDEVAMLSQGSDDQSRPPLPRLVAAARHRHATNPRDRIYGLLGCLLHGRLNLSAAYDITLSQPFVDVLIKSYQAYGVLSLLHAVGSGWRSHDHDRPKQKLSQASWFVDLADSERLDQVQQRGVWPELRPRGCFPKLNSILDNTS